MTKFVHYPDPEFVPEGHAIVPGLGITIPDPNYKKEGTVRTIAFEIYTDSFWVEFEVETSTPDILIQNLLKLKNTRNIHISK